MFFNYGDFWAPNASFRATKPACSDPKIDALINDAATANPTKANSLMQQLVDYTVQKAYFAPVFNLSNVFVYKASAVGGVQGSTSAIGYSMPLLGSIVPK